MEDFTVRDIEKAFNDLLSQAESAIRTIIIDPIVALQMKYNFATNSDGTNKYNYNFSEEKWTHSTNGFFKEFENLGNGSYDSLDPNETYKLGIYARVGKPSERANRFNIVFEPVKYVESVPVEHTKDRFLKDRFFIAVDGDGTFYQGATDRQTALALVGFFDSSSASHYPTKIVFLKEEFLKEFILYAQNRKTIKFDFARNLQNDRLTIITSCLDEKGKPIRSSIPSQNTTNMGTDDDDYDLLP